MIDIMLMFVGGIFAIIGSLGLVRFPDVYTRSHAQTVVNVGGICLILVGVMINSFYSPLFLKALFLIIFIFVTSPVGTHAITKAAYLSGVKPKTETDEWKNLKK
ncbi:MAG: monovalent cation/H(+) antiporter subunit G [Candidatus Aenigmarchaeota archaeon]